MPEVKGRLVAPNGKAIIGTFESAPGLAYVYSWYRNENGKLTPEYAGETKMYWDDQEPEIAPDGSVVVIDEDGTTWAASRCSFVEVSDE